MYKIVETVERGCKQLTVVPQAWEKHGVLFWPKMKAEKFIKIGTSTPEAGWFEMACKLKRRGLNTYETAEQELEAMLKKEESTEQEEQEVLPRQKRPRIMLPKKNAEFDYNEIAMNACRSVPDNNVMVESVPQNVIYITQPNKDPQKPVSVVPQATTSKAYQYISASSNNLVSDSSTPQNIYYINNNKTNDEYSIEQSCNSASIVTNEMLPNNGPNQPNNNNNTIDNNLSTIIENQVIIINNQNVIMEYLQNLGTAANQLKILQQLSKFEAMGDVFAEQMSNINNGKLCSCKTSSSAIQDVYVDSIDTVEHLDAFEQKLRDKDIMKENVKKLANVCGKKGNGNGINNCYLLVDRLFTRKLMTLCSWAGGARGEGEKVAFKTFKNVISLFYNVVHLSDDSFTQKDCEEFFKNVIRNSTRRNKSTLSRTSTIKRRSKKNTSETVEENEENEVENINEREINIAENNMEETEQNKRERTEENKVIIEEVCEQNIESGDDLHI